MRMQALTFGLVVQATNKEFERAGFKTEFIYGDGMSDSECLLSDSSLVEPSELKAQSRALLASGERECIWRELAFNC